MRRALLIEYYPPPSLFTCIFNRQSYTRSKIIPATTTHNLRYSKYDNVRLNSTRSVFLRFSIFSRCSFFLYQTSTIFTRTNESGILFLEYYSDIEISGFGEKIPSMRRSKIQAWKREESNYNLYDFDYENRQNFHFDIPQFQLRLRRLMQLSTLVKFLKDHETEENVKRFRFYYLV